MVKSSIVTSFCVILAFSACKTSDQSKLPNPQNSPVKGSPLPAAQKANASVIKAVVKATQRAKELLET